MGGNAASPAPAEGNAPPPTIQQTSSRRGSLAGSLFGESYSRRGSLIPTDCGSLVPTESDQQRKKVTASAAWNEFLRNKKIETIFHAYGDGALRRGPAPDPSFEPPRFRVGDISPYNSDSDDEDDESDDRQGGGQSHAPNLAQRPNRAAPGISKGHVGTVFGRATLPHPHDDAPVPPTSILLQELLSAAKEERAEWFHYEPNSNLWTPKPVKLSKASIGRGSIPSHVCVREFSSTR